MAHPLRTETQSMGRSPRKNVVNGPIDHFHRRHQLPRSTRHATRKARRSGEVNLIPDEALFAKNNTAGETGRDAVLRHFLKFPHGGAARQPYGACADRLVRDPPRSSARLPGLA
jgi:hypothetical protein